MRGRTTFKWEKDCGDLTAPPNPSEEVGHQEDKSHTLHRGGKMTDNGYKWK